MARRFFARIPYAFLRDHGDELNEWVRRHNVEWRALRGHPHYNVEVVFTGNRTRGLENQIPGVEEIQAVRITDPTPSSPPHLDWGPVPWDRYGDYPSDDEDDDEPDDRYVVVNPVWHPLEPVDDGEDIEDSLGETQSEYEANTSDEEFLMTHPDDVDELGVYDGGQSLFFEMDDDE